MSGSMYDVGVSGAADVLPFDFGAISQHPFTIDLDAITLQSVQATLEGRLNAIHKVIAYVGVGLAHPFICREAKIDGNVCLLFISHDLFAAFAVQHFFTNAKDQSEFLYIFAVGPPAQGSQEFT